MRCLDRRLIVKLESVVQKNEHRLGSLAAGTFTGFATATHVHWLLLAATCGVLGGVLMAISYDQSGAFDEVAEALRLAFETGDSVATERAITLLDALDGVQSDELKAIMVDIAQKSLDGNLRIAIVKALGRVGDWPEASALESLAYSADRGLDRSEDLHICIWNAVEKIRKRVVMRYLEGQNGV